jgi:hypothetical protein
VIRFKDAYTQFRIQISSIAFVLVLLFAASRLALGATPSLDRISCVQTTYATAGNDTCRAFLTGITTTHLYIGLSSDNGAVTVPSSITVSLNAASKGFYPVISPVSSKQTATITAKLNGIAKTFKIYLTPPTSGASLGINATSIGFGSVLVNTPQEQSVTLTSTGTSAVTVNSASITGTGFSLSGVSLPVTLNAGQSTTLQVLFDPKTVGNFSGQLTVSSSASTKSILLTGVGASHQVELSWNPPNSTSSIVGYNVYRSPSSTASYARLNGSAEPTTSYTDGTVQSGSTYKYIVKSVSSSGVESSASNATTVAVP